MKQQLDAYDAKHACIVTEQCLRHEIDEVKRELEEQRRQNHKLQVEKEVGLGYFLFSVYFVYSRSKDRWKDAVFT